ncbi:hypothetical protein B1812_06560 [Methylocystis bryophila]|uniref:Uncharacterized protein n=1 Tax=Methylocystis bryophila TaxID=655015 RepID=A0A1W6MTB7_9HYPH|nr:hypothetical protein B1812_06560 [Methylocystis bryophila]
MPPTLIGTDYDGVKIASCDGKTRACRGKVRSGFPVKTCSNLLIWRVSRSNDSVRAGDALERDAKKRKPVFRIAFYTFGIDHVFCVQAIPPEHSVI